MDILWFALWAFLPAGLANASPVVAARLPLLRRFNTPIDFGKHWHGKRIFGDSKTWRGLIFGIIVGAVTGLLQSFILQDSGQGFVGLLALAYGGLLGCGALVGDAVESFFKRQLNIPSGASWFPFDQLDYVFGGLLFASIMQPFTPQESIAIIIVWFAVHVIIVYVGFLLNVRDKPI